MALQLLQRGCLRIIWKGGNFGIKNKMKILEMKQRMSRKVMFRQKEILECLITK